VAGDNGSFEAGVASGFNCLCMAVVAIALRCDQGWVVASCDFCRTSCACEGSRASRARDMAMLRRHDKHTVCRLLVLNIVVAAPLRGWRAMSRRGRESSPHLHSTNAVVAPRWRTRAHPITSPLLLDHSHLSTPPVVHNRIHSFNDGKLRMPLRSGELTTFLCEHFAIRGS
jgi:hypothetical protein